MAELWGFNQWIALRIGDGELNDAADRLTCGPSR